MGSPRVAGRFGTSLLCARSALISSPVGPCLSQGFRLCWAPLDVAGTPAGRWGPCLAQARSRHGWRPEWRRSSACSTTTPSTDTRRRTPVTTSPGSSATPTVRRRRRRRRSTSAPGELLGSVSGELGLRKFLEDRGHTLIVTSDKDGPDSVFERELPDAEVVISQPFWPAYLTRNGSPRRPKLKLAITAGIGSDHVDLQAAIERGVTVAEVTYCNSISVSEHVVMMILSWCATTSRRYQWVLEGGWNIADCVARSYDLEGMQWARSPRGASARRCCDGLSPSMSSCTTPTGIDCRRTSSTSSA